MLARITRTSGLLLTGIVAGVLTLSSGGNLTPARAQAETDQPADLSLRRHLFRRLGPAEARARLAARELWHPGTIADSLAPALRPKAEVLLPGQARFAEVYPQPSTPARKSTSRALDCLLDPACAMQATGLPPDKAEAFYVSAQSALRDRAPPGYQCLLAVLLERNLTFLGYPGLELPSVQAHLAVCPANPETVFHQDLARMGMQAYQLVKQRNATRDELQLDKTQ